MEQTLLQKIKDFILWIVTPIAFIGGYIWYLLGQKEKLQNEVDTLKRSEVIKEDLNNADQAEKESNDAVSAFNNAMSKYNASTSQPTGTDLPGSSQSLQQSSGSTTKDD